jgi:hypothetical protein
LRDFFSDLLARHISTISGLTDAENYITRNFIIYHFHVMLLRRSKSRTITWAERVARIGKMRDVYRFLVGKPDEKRPLGRITRRRCDNIKMEKDVDQGPFGGCYEHGNVSLDPIMQYVDTCSPDERHQFVKRELTP